MQSLTPKVDMVRRDNGELILTSGYGLGEVPPNLATLMTEQATRDPDRPIIVEKNAAEQFEPMTYGEGALCRSDGRLLCGCAGDPCQHQLHLR